MQQGLVKPREQCVLLIANSRDRNLQLLLGQAGLSFRYAKLRVETFDLADTTQLPDLEMYSSVIVVGSGKTDPATDIVDKLEVYVDKGGGLVVIDPGVHPHLSELCGIDLSEFGLSCLSDCAEIDRPTIQFCTDFFPGVGGLSVEVPQLNKCCRYRLHENANSKLIATVLPDIPLGWQRDIGLGSVIVWNMDLYSHKWCRVLLLQSVLGVQQLGVQWIANVGMIQIDDFPAGLVDSFREPVKSEFGMSMVKFYDQIWLPDMIELASSYAVKYSFAIPFNYNHTIDAPFGFEEWECETSSFRQEEMPAGVYFSRIVGEIGELGLHGYNHLPLKLDAWGSQQAMVDSLTAALTRWKEDNLGPVPTSYVPPMNEYDAAGAQALTQAIPEMRVICGSWWAPRSEGGREFEPERWNPNLFCLPRITHGYEITGKNHLYMTTCLAEIGVWTHMMHPDDIYDIPPDGDIHGFYRNADKCRWRDIEHNSMRDSFAQWLRFASENFPWLRYMTATPAANEIQQHISNEVETIFHEKYLGLKSQHPAFIQIRGRKTHDFRLTAMEGAEILHSEEKETYNLWVVSVPEGECKLLYG